MDSIRIHAALIALLFCLTSILPARAQDVQ